jgi:predicted Ser/Thr protein kinase
MTPERSRQVEQLWSQALDRDPGERKKFLQEACAGDDELCAEVESRLVRERSAKDFLEQSASFAMTVAPDAVSGVTPGFQLGPYRIEALLGEGGMGQVFRAHDARLRRPVAIKIAKQGFAERFEREARAISALNHPNICTLFDVGPNYLVMELVEGVALSEQLKKRKLSIGETLRYGSQIADALAEAHANGIVHRDLKPGNVMLSKNGVKVLDFGIAKTRSDENITGINARLGTPDYMAPEQHAGKECDARTDIYALGLLLSEMATGRRGARHGVSAQLVRVIDRCLEEDPENRWQSARDVTAVLQWIAQTPPPKAPLNQTLPIRRTIAAVLVVVVIAAIVAAYIASRPRQAPVARFMFTTPFTGTAVDVAVSPDGNQIAFTSASGDSSLWLRSLDSLTAREVPGTQRAFRPFWLSDGGSLAFIAQTEGLAGLGSFSELRRVEIAGERYFAQKVISPVSLAGTALNTGGVILYQPELTGTPLFRIASGESPTPVTRLNLEHKEITHRYPQFLPDGRHFLYWVWSAVAENTGICIGSLDPGEKLPACPLVRTWREARYAEPGYLLFLEGSRLMCGRPSAFTVTSRPSSISHTNLSIVSRGTSA